MGYIPSVDPKQRFERKIALRLWYCFECMPNTRYVDCVVWSVGPKAIRLLCFVDRRQQSGYLYSVFWSVGEHQVTFTVCVCLCVCVCVCVCVFGA